MTTLEIRHRLWMDGAEYVVAENFGDQPETQWRVPDRASADALIEERKTMLTELVASISKRTRQAVENARHIDNLKAGRA